MFYRSEISGFLSAAGCHVYGNADPGQGNPGWRIARRKGVDQALDDFVVVCFNFSQRIFAKVERLPGVFRFVFYSATFLAPFKRPFPPRWDRPVHAVATAA